MLMQGISATQDWVDAADKIIKGARGARKAMKKKKTVVTSPQPEPTYTDALSTAMTAPFTLPIIAVGVALLIFFTSKNKKAWGRKRR